MKIWLDGESVTELRVYFDFMCSFVFFCGPYKSALVQKH